jgi:hypothetical protein
MKFLWLLFFTQAFANTLVTPTELSQTMPTFKDDKEFARFEQVAQRQMSYFNRVSMKGTIQFGDDQYDREIMRKTLEEFMLDIAAYKKCLKVLADNPFVFKTPKDYCMERFNSRIQARYKVYKPVSKEKKTFFTAYYSPDLEGSKKKEGEYVNPIYALPEEDSLRRLTREEIDFEGKLEGHGYELFYVKQSLFDLYLFHVEGGGRIRVKQEDGSFKKRYLSYHGSNKRKFAFIYHHMLAQGMISEENRSLEAQRKYLEQHPLKRREVYATNPSYIFFKVTDDEPLGVGNIPLTQGRSLAIDTRIYKWPGMLHFVQMDLPQLNGLGEVQAKQMKRFFLSQDTGEQFADLLESISIWVMAAKLKSQLIIPRLMVINSS